MNLDWMSILKQILAEVEPELAGLSTEAVTFGRQQLVGIASRIEHLAGDVITGNLTKEEAHELLQMDLNHAKEVLAIAEGFGEIAADRITAKAGSIAQIVFGGIVKAIL